VLPLIASFGERSHEPHNPAPGLSAVAVGSRLNILGRSTLDLLARG
jgi:hypothetical protein